MSSAQERMLELLQTHTDEDLTSTSSWFRQMVDVINDLVNNDFARLVSVLYQADVSEKKLKEVLNENPDTNAAELIATLLLERQLQKIKSRNEFNNSDLHMEEDEKW